MLRDKPEDAALLDYCASLEKELKAAGIRVLVDAKPIKSAEKRWNWVRRGAPVIVEIGPRDAAGGNVTYMRRDKLRDGDKVVSHTRPRAEFVAEAPALLDDIQARLYAEAKARLDGNIVTDDQDIRRARGVFRRGGSRRRRRRLQGLGIGRLVEAGRSQARGDRRKVKGAEAHDPQRTARPSAGPGCMPVHRGSMIGRSNASANSQSRWSWPGAPMIAPVP